MRARSVLPWLVVAVTAAAWRLPAAPADAAPGFLPGPVGPRSVSALVTLDGPSVFDLYERAAGLAPTAEETVARAAEQHEVLRLAESAVIDRQAPVVEAARRLGIDVISRYSTVANGLLVHATSAQLEALGRVPGVAAIEPAPMVKPELKNSVPYIGADALAAALGFDGEGTVVAVIDTGVDYTHQHLGGPGTVPAFTAANAAGMTETITDTWEGVPLFPNDKVIGGYDFVGPNYNPYHTCPPNVPPPGCSSTPNPDPDPLDGGSHGTHVSGIVAGMDTPTLGHGVAPAAKLVGLKIYGTNGGDEAADVLVDAIEWCARVNLGLETRGTLPPRVDAINISLGEGHAQGSRLFDEAVSRAVDAGIIVVASAGNAGNRPWVLGAPSASPRLLSVASGVPPQQSLSVITRQEGVDTEHAAIESGIARPLSAAGAIDAELRWFGSGCNDSPVFQDVDEMIALIERGDCVFAEKILNAQNQGALAVLMFTNAMAKNAMGGSGTGIEIPAVMIDRLPGVALTTTLSSGITVTARIDPALSRIDYDVADAASGFTSRGPSKNGALKPDITGPGSGIVSTAKGSGTSGANFSGTSMSGPHLAGAAAVMQHRNRAENLGLGADDLAALLMNYARPVVFEGGNRANLSAITRQGAGMVDLVRAGKGQLLVRAGDIASENVGALAFYAPASTSRAMAVTNLSDAPIAFAVSARSQFPDDNGRGMTVGVPEAPVTVPAKGTVPVQVDYVFDPTQLREWPLLGPGGGDVNAVQQVELDGYITLQPLGADGAPDPEALAPSVPYYVLARPASDIKSRVVSGADGAEGAVLHVANVGGLAGRAEGYLVPWLADGNAPEDPDEADVAFELDLRRVGVRLEPAATVSDTTRLSFAVATWETAAIPQVTNVEIYLDTDGDGGADFRVRDASTGDTMQTRVAAWSVISGTIAGPESAEGTGHVTDVHTRVRQLSIPLSALGEDPPTAFDFWVVHRGLNEDWAPFTPSTDAAPDGADHGVGPRYRFDPAEAMWLPRAWSMHLDQGASIDAPLESAGGERAADLLMIYPSNSFLHYVGSQLEIVPLPSRGGTIYLPELKRE